MKRKGLALLALVLAVGSIAGCKRGGGSTGGGGTGGGEVEPFEPVPFGDPASATTSVLSTKAAWVAPTLPAGHTQVKSYKQWFTADMTTFDYLATYHASNSEILVNLVDGLVEYDEYGFIRGALAKEAYSNSNFTVFKFVIRDNVKWVDANGEEISKVTAQDFVNGFQHLLDAQGGLEYLVDGVVANAGGYMAGLCGFDKVGIKAIDEHTLVYYLEQSVPYFITMLEYNPFMPICSPLFKDKGGKYGVEEWAEVAETCKYGEVGNISSIGYCGAFMFDSFTKTSSMKLKRNVAYWDNEHTTLDEVTYTYNKGDNLKGNYDAFKNGDITSTGVSDEILADVRADYGAEGTVQADSINVADTNATTYYGVFNLNRETYASQTTSSNKTDSQKADTKAAIKNKNFRKAFQAAWDKKAYNGQSVGDDLSLNALRNMLTAPEFVSVGSETYGDLVEKEYKTLNPKFGSEELKEAGRTWGTLADGNDGFYNSKYAVELMQQAYEELKDVVTFPIKIDLMVYMGSTNQAKQANSIKNSIETAFQNNIVTEKDKDGNDVKLAKAVMIQIMEATTTTDFYNATYYASTGSESNFDFYYGSGWGPDYGDPLTYLNIFKWEGDMMSVIGCDVGDEADKAIYDAVLPNYNAELDAASALSGDARIQAFAKLEAKLLDSGLITPHTTQGGNYIVTRIVPRCVPYTLSGTDNEKMKHLVISDKVLTAAQVAEYKEAWKTAKDAA